MSCKEISNKIFVVFDTNIIKLLNPNLKEFSFGRTYNIFEDFVINNELNNIKICVPKIVIEELITQYIEEYKNIKQKVKTEFDKIEQEANQIGWNINLEKEFDKENKDYVEYIKKKAYEYITVHKKLTVIDFPSNEKMTKIIDRSIRKKKPFFKGKYKQKSFSDAGFKDVIFIESIIEFSEKEKGRFLILTKDNFVQEIDVQNEFECDCEIKNFDEGKKIINYFENKYSIQEISKYKKFIKTDYYQKEIEEVLEKVLKTKKIEILTEEIKINENNENTFVEIIVAVLVNNEKSKIIVILSEEKDFIEIKKFDTGEVIWEW